MNPLSLLKAHSPLLRVIVWGAVIAYVAGRAHSMVEIWATVATYQAEETIEMEVQARLAGLVKGGAR